MMVYGTTDFSDSIRDYLAKVSIMHFGISGFLAAALLAAALFFGGETGRIIGFSACALPFMLQVWFIRRSLYCTMQLPSVATVSLLYSVTLVGGLFVLRYVDMVIPLYIYGVFILASLVCVAYYRIAVVKKTHTATAQASPVKQIIRRHWKFGKWLVIASVAASVSTLLYAPILGLMSNLKDVAAYKAIQNLSLPFSQILTVFTMLMLPIMSRVVKNDSRERIHRYIWSATAGFGLFAALYGLFLLVFGRQILMLLYANKFYVEYCWMIPVFAFVILIRSINQSLATAIRAYESTRTILAAKIGSALVVLFTLMIFVPTRGLHGVLLAMCLGVLTEFGIVVRFFLHPDRRSAVIRGV